MINGKNLFLTVFVLSMLLVLAVFSAGSLSAFVEDSLLSPLLDQPASNDSGNAINVSKIPVFNLPSAFNMKWLVENGKYVSTDYKRLGDLSFGNPSDYSKVEGITCFRGNNYRNSASYGTVDLNSKKLEKVWSCRIGRIDSWTGVGWNGQPAVIKWDDSLRKSMNLFENKKQKPDLKEVIYGALDSKVYFLDLETGDATRNPINVNGPIKGSISVDPRGYPLLYVGQGINMVNGKKVPIGYSIFNLLDQKRLFFINGIESFGAKGWGAFDSTGLVNSQADTLVEAGENGVVYTVKLNTKFDAAKSKLSISPKLTKYRYKTSRNKKLGIENSIAIYKNYAYFADNDGVLQCIDLNTLSPVWVRDITDDTDSTTVLEEQNDKVYLYTGCEVDWQGSSKGLSYIRKINALTGELIWYRTFPCYYSNTNGGVLGTPVLGKNDLDNLVIYDVAKCKTGSSGKLIAFDKSSGKTVWEIPFNNYSWSSPVDVYTPEGKGYIVFCDSAGNMFLIDGKEGKILDRISLGANVEGSPAVYEDMIVVGTRGQKIWGVRIK